MDSALALLFRRGAAWDVRRSFLLAIALFGFVLFSVSRNKLAGYLLPLIPALAVLVGSQFETKPLAEFSRKWLLAPTVLIATIPVVAGALPATLAARPISSFRLPPFTPTEAFYVAAPLAALMLGRRTWILLLLVLCIAAGGIFLKSSAYPEIDETVSARGLWREIKTRHLTVCNGGINRDWLYGLSFYSGAAIPDCGHGHYDAELTAHGRSRPALPPKR